MGKIIPFLNKSNGLTIESDDGITITSTAYEEPNLNTLIEIKDLAKKLITDIITLEEPIEDSVVVHLFWYNQLKNKIMEFEDDNN